MRAQVLVRTYIVAVAIRQIKSCETLRNMGSSCFCVVLRVRCAHSKRASRGSSMQASGSRFQRHLRGISAAMVAEFNRNRNLKIAK